MPLGAKWLVWPLLLPTMSTFGTVLAYCLPMYDTMQELSAGLLLHTWTRDGLVYILLCDIGWAKWALSIGLALCTITADRCVCCHLPGRGSVLCLVLLYRVLCWVFLNWQVPLYRLYGEVENLTNGSKKLSCSNCIIVVQICAVITKNVSGTKMFYFDKCKRNREMRGLWAEECTREESATLLVLQSHYFVQRRGCR
jgi:hypothetical protein